MVDLILEISKSDNKYVAKEILTGIEVPTDRIPEGVMYKAYSYKFFIGRNENPDTGNVIWKRYRTKADIPSEYKANTANFNFSASKHKVEPAPEKTVSVTNGITPEKTIREKIADSITIKPDTLVIPDLMWKAAFRAALRGENIMLLGFSGCGKTLTARKLADALKRPLFKFNMGAMQDPRASLIGNTFYSPDKGTFFSGSDFVKAIQTENAIILLDEMTRISPDGENIMMTVLDRDQRYLRIDESPDVPVINVHPSVVFVATANIGAEFTSTRVIDRATRDRFGTMIEVPLLTADEEVKLAKKLFPELNTEYIRAFAEVADYTRKDVRGSNPTLTTIISTRSVHEQCRLALDGFNFSEVMELAVLTMFDSEGGADSNRTHVRQVCQKKSHLDNVSPLISEVKQQKQETTGKKKEKNSDIIDLFDIDNDAIS